MVGLDGDSPLTPTLLCPAHSPLPLSLSERVILSLYRVLASGPRNFWRALPLPFLSSNAMFLSLVPASLLGSPFLS